MAEGIKPVIYVISDSLGETAEMVARAAASQFDGGRSEIRRIPYVNTLEHLEDVLNEASTVGAVIAYTVILPELRQQMQHLIQEKNLIAVDILGPMVEAVGRRYGLTPKLKPGLLWQMDEQYFRRVEAIEFAVKYDDGKDARGLPLADIVLIGVSRTSKTPLSMYLAHKRLKVANVPLVPEVPLPKELTEIPSRRVVALTIKPNLLNSIRTERLKALGLASNASYASMDRILRELEYAEQVVKRLGCPVIDVTNKAIEETASRILEIYNKGEQ
ncbi:MAG: pyruvate, water dikinase regulatory protein [Bacillota bacterium]|jgi:regulator of PEP synthase PpsR (kinase-PPPase family)